MASLGAVTMPRVFRLHVLAPLLFFCAAGLLLTSCRSTAAAPAAPGVATNSERGLHRQIELLRRACLDGRDDALIAVGTPDWEFNGPSDNPIDARQFAIAAAAWKERYRLESLTLRKRHLDVQEDRATTLYDGKAVTHDSAAADPAQRREAVSFTVGLEWVRTAAGWRATHLQIFGNLTRSPLPAE